MMIRIQDANVFLQRAEPDWPVWGRRRLRPRSHTL